MHRILCLLVFPAVVHGQTAQETVERKLEFATGQFQTTDEGDFVVATPYVKSHAGVTGSPFWATDVWCNAEVLYKGEMHQVPELKYDCANDLMVIPRYTEEGVIYLNLIPVFYSEIFIYIKHTGNLRGKVASGSAAKREHFIFYPATKDERSDGTPPGYYHYLIEKPVSLLCKYSSSIVDHNGRKAFEEDEEKFYLQEDGTLSRIRRVGSFLDAFPQWKDKINTFVEENKINTMVLLNSGDNEKLIEFINTLSPQ